MNIQHKIKWRFEYFQSAGRQLFCKVDQNISGDGMEIYSVINRSFAVYRFSNEGGYYPCTYHSFLKSVRGMKGDVFKDDELKNSVRLWLQRRVFFVGGASSRDIGCVYQSVEID